MGLQLVSPQDIKPTSRKQRKEHVLLFLLLLINDYTLITVLYHMK